MGVRAVHDDCSNLARGLILTWPLYNTQIFWRQIDDDWLFVKLKILKIVWDVKIGCRFLIGTIDSHLDFSGRYSLIDDSDIASVIKG